MSLKQEIETWVQALAQYDNNEFEEAVKTFSQIADTSKILFNIGVIQATLGEHDKAVEKYQRAVKLDQYFAVAYFQQGVSNFLLGDFEEALANFNDTLLYLRGNTQIDYDQLGLKFKLHSCEVLFNRGLCYIYLQQVDNGMQDFNFAVKEKAVEDHNVIDEAIRDQGEGYTVFSIPVGIVYRPNEAKVKNLKTKDYLGKARLVAAADSKNAFTGFAGIEAKKIMAESAVARDDRPDANRSFAAENLVKPGIQSRARQQSEPPMNRQMFPPTPPPEEEKQRSFGRSDSNATGSSGGLNGRAASVRAGPQWPRDAKTKEPMRDSEFERPRLGTFRTASEPRGPTRQYSRRPDVGGRSRMQESSGSQRRRRGSFGDDYDDEGDDAFGGDIYDMYSGGDRGDRERSNRMPAPKPRRAPSKMRPQYIEEEDEYASDAYDDESVLDEDFDMMSNGSGRGSRRGGGAGRGPKRTPELTKIRVKVHNEDTRYVMIGPACELPDLVDRIRSKFGIRRRFKCKIRDEDGGEMITLSDQDDLDMAILACKANAKREASEMGKMELWIQEVK